MNKLVVVKTVYEGKRGCGFRKPGGLYLRLDKCAWAYCGKLPLPLEICPCCGAGIRFSRAWTWVNGQKLFQDVECRFKNVLNHSHSCEHCPLDKNNLNRLEKCGLIWIGEQFYKTPADWIHEANRMGISRRLTNIPQGFKVGVTTVLVAHRKAVPTELDGKTVMKPGIFQCFTPDRIEYVVKGNETEEQLQKLIDRGITLVNVVRT